MQVGNILEVSLSNDPYFRGMWKVGKVISIVEENGITRERYELFRNENRIFVETVPNDPGLALFKHVETNNDRNLSIPPDPVIFLGETEYRTLDPSHGNPGFKANYDGTNILHWEYSNQKGDAFFQVLYYKEEGVIDIFTGEQSLTHKVF